MLYSGHELAYYEDDVMRELASETRDDYADLVIDQVKELDIPGSHRSTDLSGAIYLLSQDLIRDHYVANPAAYFAPVVSFSANRLHQDIDAEEQELVHPEVQSRAVQLLVDEHAPAILKDAIRKIGPLVAEVMLDRFSRNAHGTMTAYHHVAGHTSFSRRACGNELLLDGGILKFLDSAGFMKEHYRIMDTRRWERDRDGKGPAMHVTVYRSALFVGAYHETGKDDDEGNPIIEKGEDYYASGTDGV